MIVGKYIEKFNQLTGQSLPVGDIQQSAGLVKHVQKHHPNEVNLVSDIPQIIAAPDYIGTNPNEPNSIELVKQIGLNAMVCVKLDTKKGYLYVASVYSISNAKLAKRINSGRLKKC